ncbi:MAG: calcium-binding protein [Pikeienuella sp.]
MATRSSVNDKSNIPLGGEFRINSFTTSVQNLAHIAALKDGGFVIIWQSGDLDGDNLGISAQRYDANGAPLGAEFQVNTYTTSAQNNPGVAALADGGFVVTWKSFEQDGDDFGIFAQGYDAGGVRQGVEFQVNATTASRQEFPSVGALPDGDFIILWDSFGQDGSAPASTGVFAQRYGADGVAKGSEFQISTETAGNQSNPVMAALSGGGFVITWVSRGQDGDERGVYAQRYEANGDKAGGEFRVNTETDLNQSSPNIAALADGGFIIAWESDQQDGSGFGVYAQRYDKDGVAQGTEFLVNSTTANTQRTPNVTALSDGGFLITWESDQQDGSSWGIYAQRYDKDGARVGEEFLVNTYVDDYQRTPYVEALPDGGFAIAWTSNLQDGDSLGLYGQLYLDNRVSTGDPVIRGEAKEDETLTVDVSALADADGLGAFAYAWLRDGAPIAGANGASYTPIGDDIGARLSVRISYTDGRATRETITSDPTAAVTKASDDTLTGGAGGEQIDGGGGDDQINGGGGDDTLLGGKGDDKLDGGEGDDQLIGGDGDDTMAGGAGDDHLTGDDDRTPTGGGAGGDMLYGGVGGDRLFGGEGGDCLFGGMGPDTLFGGAGADCLFGDEGRDLLDGGAGADTMRGGRGDDRLEARAGADRLDGGRGQDILAGNGGDDLIKGDRGRDALYGGGGDDTLEGGRYADRLEGGAGKDILKGGRADDRLIGGGGDERLNGGLGEDILMGGAGADRFQFRADTGDDVIRDFQDGQDSIAILSGADGFADLEIFDTQNGALVAFGRVSILFMDIGADQIDRSDFLF